MATRRIAVGSLLGPPFVGKVYDLSGHYAVAFFAVGGIVLLAVPVFCLAAFCRRSIDKPSLPRAADLSCTQAMQESEKFHPSDDSRFGKCKL